MIFVLLLLAPMVGCAQRNNVKGNSPAQSQVDILIKKLASGEIVRVEILQIPSRILTRARITPEMLEKQFHYKLTIRDLRGGAHHGKLIEAMKSIAVHPQSEIADLRWGVIFYSMDDVRVGDLCFDKSGKSGAVNDTAVSIKGDFFNSLENSFSNCFK